MSGRVLVTGCTGLVGHGICLHLLGAGYEVWGTSRRDLTSRHEHFHTVRLDLTTEDSVSSIASLMKDVDVIIHNAARIPRPSAENVDEREAYFNTNLLGTYRMLDLAARSDGGKRFIFISTTALVDDRRGVLVEDAPYVPRNDYVASKIAAEIACQQYALREKVRLVVFRIRAPYGYAGTRQGVIPKFIAMAKASQDISLWGAGAREQVFTFVEDIGQACEAAIRKEAAGTYNIAGSSSTSMKELAESILQTWPASKSRIVFTEKTDPEDGRRIVVSIEKAKRELGYLAQHSIQDGLMKIAKRDDSPDIHFFEFATS